MKRKRHEFSFFILFFFSLFSSFLHVHVSLFLYFSFSLLPEIIQRREKTGNSHFSHRRRSGRPHGARRTAVRPAAGGRRRGPRTAAGPADTDDEGDTRASCLLLLIREPLSFLPPLRRRRPPAPDRAK